MACQLRPVIVHFIRKGTGGFYGGVLRFSAFVKHPINRAIVPHRPIGPTH